MFPRISSVVALIAFSAWLAREPGWEPAVGFIVSLVAYLGIEATQHKKEEQEGKSGHKVRGNEIISARVLSEDGCKIEVEIWYFYDGSLGQEDIGMSVTPLGRNGQPLPGGMSAHGGGVTIIGHRARTVYHYRHQPPPDTKVLARTLRITMEKDYHEIFCERNIRFRRDWSQKNQRSEQGAAHNGA